jgi:internalin A
MRRLGAGTCVIVILNKAYFESKYCMYELTQIASCPEFARWVYPVVLPDARIFGAVTRIGYVKYWETKRAELNAAMKENDLEHLEGIRDDLDLYGDIRDTIARLMSVLADMYTLTPDHALRHRLRTTLHATDGRARGLALPAGSAGWRGHWRARAVRRIRGQDGISARW